MRLEEEIKIHITNDFAVRIELDEGEGWMKVIHHEVGCIETVYLGEMGGSMQPYRDVGADICVATN